MAAQRRSARIDREGIGEQYGVSDRTVDAWTRLINFPQPVEGKWDAREVSSWVRANRPQSWPGKHTPQQESSPQGRNAPQASERRPQRSTTPTAASSEARSSGRRGATATSPAPQDGGGVPTIVIPPPEGHPEDLLDVDDYRTIWGNATRGMPVERGTLFKYRSIGHLPEPDRVPDDGLEPEVLKPMWFRKTVNKSIADRKRPSGRPRKKA
ncbi:hypothetical protein [Streptomyces klenkii]|uniref:hypothetical protein n=1 Tax=Streptomyces klenkii TaxID=1420899 RepID=UPI003422A662